MLNPPPASFKFSSKRAGGLPADEDLLRVIRTGLKGTAMPAFRFLPDPAAYELRSSPRELLSVEEGRSSPDETVGGE